MPDSIARIASLSLALAFGWAGVSKLISFKRWSDVLDRYGLPKAVKPPATILTPLIELIVSAAIVLGATRSGAMLAIGMLLLFGAAILRAREINGDRLPCGCFGGSSQRHYTTMLWRNTALGALAVLTLSVDGNLGPAWPSAPVAEQLLPAALTVVGTALILWVVWQASISLRGREHR